MCVYACDTVSSCPFCGQNLKVEFPGQTRLYTFSSCQASEIVPRAACISVVIKHLHSPVTPVTVKEKEGKEPDR